MLLHVPQCTGCHPTPKNDPAPNVGSAQVEKPWAKSENLSEASLKEDGRWSASERWPGSPEESQASTRLPGWRLPGSREGPGSNRGGDVWLLSSLRGEGRSWAESEGCQRARSSCCGGQGGPCGRPSSSGDLLPRDTCPPGCRALSGWEEEAVG